MPNLTIGAEVDTEQLKSGLATSVTDVQQAVSKINVQFNEMSSKAASAVRHISSETKAMAASVSQDFVKSATASVEYSRALSDVRNAMTLVRESAGEDTNALNLLAAAKQKAAVASKELAQAERASAGASEMVVSSQAAASGAVRALEGNLLRTTRPAELFLSSVLGLGPIIQKAFPVIGAIAFLDILVRLKDSIRGMMDSLSGWNAEAKADFEERSKQLSTMVQQVDQLANAQAGAAGAGQSGLGRTETEIAAQQRLNDSLQSRYAQLQNLSSAIESVKENHRTLLESLDNTKFSGDLAGGSAARFGVSDEVQQQTAQHNALLDKQRAAVDSATAAFSAYFSTINDQAKAAGLNIRDVSSAAKLLNTALASDNLADISKQYDAFRSSLDALQVKIKENSIKITSDNKNLTTEQIEDARTKASQLLEITLASIASQKAAAQLLYQQGTIDAQQWLEAQTTADKLAYQAHEDYFTKVRALYASNPEKEAAIQAEQSKFKYEDLSKVYGEAAQALEKYQAELRDLNEENQAKGASEEKQILDQRTRSVKDYIAALHSQAEAQQRIGETQREIAESSKVQAIDNSAALGLITEKQKAEMLLALYQKEEQDLLKHLQDMRTEQQQNVATLQSSVAADPNNTALKTSLATAQAQVAQSDQQILQVQQRFGAQINSQQLTIWKQMEAPMNTFFNSMQQGITRATGEWLTGSRSFASAFEQSIGQMIVAEVQWGEKTLLNDAAVWAKKAILHQTANATAAASNAAAAAQQVTTTVATDTAQVISEAGLAAAKAYAAYAEIPPVAAVMAAEAEATVLSFLPQASAEGGFDVPKFLPGGSMTTLIHPNEMVLPSGLAQGVRDLTNFGAGFKAPTAMTSDLSNGPNSFNQTSSTNSAHSVNNTTGGNFHYHAGDVHALDGNGVEKALNNNRNHVTKMVKQAVRSGAINPRKLI